jgi:signal transduction histidine kinase/streptogramin lyase
MLDGVARIHGGDEPVVFAHDPVETVSAMLVDSTGRLWIGSSRLQRWDGSRFVGVPLPDPSATYNWVKALAEDREGSVWVGTTRHGVYRWRDGDAVAYTEADGLTNDSVRSLLSDRDGNVWIGTDVGGLNRLKRRRVFSYQRPASIEQSIAPIVDDGANGLWIGATCGGLLHFRNGTFLPVAGDSSVTAGCIWSLMRDPDGTVWVGGMGQGLIRLRDNKTTQYTHVDGLASDLVTSVVRDRDGVLWVGSDGGLSRFEDGRFTNYGPRDGLEERVMCITQDRSGALWAGGLGGLYRFADGRFTRYTKAQGLSNDYVRAIHEDRDGALWIGTYGGGLNRFKNGRFTAFGPKVGLPDTAVSRIIEDDRGNFWMSGNKGVVRVARSDLDAVAYGRATYVPSVSFGTADGMMTDETNGGQPAGWRGSDGSLWFPTIKGLVKIDSTPAATKPPPVFVEHVIADGRESDLARPGVVARGSADVQFRFTAVDLTAAEKTRFRYRLSHYDRDWIEAGDRRVAYYTQIPPGEYRFEVRAANADGVWSATPAGIAFVVMPLWWQRREVQGVGFGLLLAATGFSVWLVSQRRARARVAELEREQALDRERSRIARDLHDDLGSRLTHIAMMADSGSGASEGRIALAARDAARTMDELVWAVNARNDTVEGFAFYLAQFAEEHIVAAGIRCRLMLPPELPAQGIGADVRRHLYLACKEAVNNAVKHSGASEIHVLLSVDASRLVVEVADNGRGLPAAVDPTGNGLKNYRERMDAAGGTVRVDAPAGRGTRVAFAVPLQGT